MAAFRDLVTDAILAALAGLPFEVGDGVAPVPDQGPDVPYAMLSGIPVFAIDGPLDQRNADITWQYQITGVGPTRKAAEWVLRQVANVLLVRGAVTMPTGLALAGDVELAPAFDPDRDSSAFPERFIAGDIYRFPTTPG